MSQFSGNLPRKFNSFCSLGFEFSAHNLSGERKSQNLQNIAPTDEVKIDVINETSNSAAKSMSVLQTGSSG